VDVPGQQFLDAVDGMVGDTRQHLAQIGFGIETVEFRRTNQAVDRRRPLPASIRSLPVRQGPYQSANTNRIHLLHR
jgi:hypothetical protein